MSFILSWCGVAVTLVLLVGIHLDPRDLWQTPWRDDE